MSSMMSHLTAGPVLADDSHSSNTVTMWVYLMVVALHGLGVQSGYGLRQDHPSRAPLRRTEQSHGRNRRSQSIT